MAVHHIHWVICAVFLSTACPGASSQPGEKNPKFDSGFLGEAGRRDTGHQTFTDGDLTISADRTISPRADTASPAPDRQWVVVGTQQITRFVAGVVHEGRIYGGTHLGGNSEIYDFPPFRRQQFFGGESVLDFQAFKGALYSSHENGARLYRLEGDQWQLVHDHGPSWDYLFFMTTFQGMLYVTGGTATNLGLLRSLDGASFSLVADLPGWLWLPIEYQGALYLLGHGGTGYAEEPAQAMKSLDGISFEPVPTLDGGPEYQCAHLFDGQLYLGTGGWTNARTSDNSAKIYRYDGAARIEVLAVNKNGVTSIASGAGKIYAAVDSGWERTSGDSRLYVSEDGLTWSQMRTFPEPELRYVEVRPDGSLLVFGGTAGVSGTIYAYE